MKYTTTANFALSGINSGVLSKITGDLGQTVQKAKNWLQKAGQAKQEVAATGKRIITPSPYALKRTTPLSSSNQGVEEVIRQKYGQPVVNQATLDRGQASDLVQKSQALSASTRNQNYKTIKNAQKYGFVNDPGTGKRTDMLNELNKQQFSRVRYEKDPLTGKLVRAYYSSPISLLCDL